MILNIIPRLGVGTIVFGMTKSEVRSIVGTPFKEFIRGAQEGPKSDQFIESGIFAYYKSDEKLEAFEFCFPADVLLNGHRLVGVSLPQGRAILLSDGGDFREEAAGGTSFGLGVSLYTPYRKEDPNAPVESVLVFEDGYFDR
jgi:hypothetical protein